MIAITLLVLALLVVSALLLRRRLRRDEPAHDDFRRVGEQEPTSPGDSYHRHGATTGIIGGGS
ncbi:hypothetical protein [Luteipulveratus halotolerans]|uniref:Uncharacterized protein n=1 Tax=Luteipulveratus halotolerans TaxID=1631356 RepID=A0A0L6CH28_9MICO|nr:hypothetical protein [Luteipulveratus halotolerans]KNX37111.1 hypothetical protein VV01_08070 [Luteipulveratus halotolerans]